VNGRIVGGESVHEEDLDHVANFGAQRRTLYALPEGLWQERAERGVRVLSVQRFLPFRARFDVAGHLGPRRGVEGNTKPVIPACGCVVPGDFIGGDVVAANGAAKMEVRRGGAGEGVVHGGGARDKGGGAAGAGVWCGSRMGGGEEEGRGQEA